MLSFVYMRMYYNYVYSQCTLQVNLILVVAIRLRSYNRFLCRASCQLCYILYTVFSTLYNEYKFIES